MIFLSVLFASQISKVGFEVLTATFKLVIFIYITAFCLIAVYSIAIWLNLGGRYLNSIQVLKQPMLIALGTASSFAAIPSTLQSLTKGFRLKQEAVDLMVPLGVTIYPPGSVLHFAISTVFIAQIYGVSLSYENMLLVLIGATLAGMAAAGAPGIVGVSMISIILEPLQLPVGVAVILLAAIDPIVDPILTTVNIHANCAATAMIAEQESV